MKDYILTKKSIFLCSILLLALLLFTEAIKPSYDDFPILLQLNVHWIVIIGVTVSIFAILVTIILFFIESFQLVCKSQSKKEEKENEL